MAMAGESTSTKPIIYLSEYEFGVDEKRRVQIPSKWRPENPEGVEWVALRWQTDLQRPPCLLVLPPAAFQLLHEKVAALPFSDPQAETLRRSLTRAADTVSLDGAGRICLPKPLADAAGITKRAWLVGMFDRFQIWSPENYASVRAEDERNTVKALSLI